jgi:uncharacterized protein (DUF697 family)
MTDEQREKCHTIIHGAATSGAAVGAGIAQLPGADNVVLAGIEASMVIALANVFDVALDKAGAMALMSGYLGTTVGRAASQFLIGWIPGIGNAINASTAAGIIEKLGWDVVIDFDKRKNY